NRATLPLAAVERVVARALDPDPDQRYVNATELEEDMEEVLSDATVPCARHGEVAEFVTAQQSRVEASLDEETEDLLAELSAPAAAAIVEEESARAASADSELDDFLQDLGDLEEPAAGDEAAAPRGLSVLGDLEKDL